MHRRTARADQHRVAHDTHDAEEDGVQRALLLLVREVRRDEIRNGAEGVARNRQDLDHGVTRLGHDAPDDRREERRKAVKHGVAAELREAERPYLPVQETLADVGPVELGCALGVARLAL